MAPTADDTIVCGDYAVTVDPIGNGTTQLWITKRTPNGAPIVFRVPLTPEHLDALIAHLTAARDARAPGAGGEE